MNMEYESVRLVESEVADGVKYTVSRMSFMRRMDLMRKVRELARRKECLEAGKTPAERMDAVILQAEIDRVYVTWGLRSIDGLTIDGTEATPESLASAGPEDLFREALAAVRRESGLSEAERKN